MPIPEETLKTLNSIILNWQKAIVVAVLFIALVVCLFPIAIVGFLLGQQTGNIPSVQVADHRAIMTNQASIKTDHLGISTEMLKMGNEVRTMRQIMAAQSEDSIYVLRTMCTNASKNKEQETKCQKTKWMREYEEAQNKQP